MLTSTGGVNAVELSTGLIIEYLNICVNSAFTLLDEKLKKKQITALDVNAIEPY